jgi:hypothetical protein
MGPGVSTWLFSFSRPSCFSSMLEREEWLLEDTELMMAQATGA